MRRTKVLLKYIVDEKGCWLFTGYIDKAGYGRCCAGSLAHRIFYQRLVGPIPAGHEVHQRCQIRRCVNPDHLEALTHEEHVTILTRYIVDGKGCWIYTGRLTKEGYGQCAHNWLAHRFFYQQLVGPIPAGHELHHRCEIKRCVNPEHLEPLTHEEHVAVTPQLGSNSRRKTHCPRGHEYSSENTCHSRGRRCCLACNRENCKRWYSQRKKMKGGRA